jgi:hypothetical protein
VASYFTGIFAIYLFAISSGLEINALGIIMHQPRCPLLERSVEDLSCKAPAGSSYMLLLRITLPCLGLNRGQKGEPAFYLIKTFFLSFFAQKNKQIRWEAGRGLSFLYQVAPVTGVIRIPLVLGALQEERQAAGPAGRPRQSPAKARLLVPARGTGNCKQSSCCCDVAR